MDKAEPSAIRPDTDENTHFAVKKKSNLSNPFEIMWVFTVWRILK